MANIWRLGSLSKYGIEKFPLVLLTRVFSVRISSFENAKAALNTLKSEPNNDVKLRIYALFKQEKATGEYVDVIAKLVAEESPKEVQPPTLYGEVCVGLEMTESNGILKIRLDRPDKKNAITPEMYEAWANALNQAATNAKVKLVAVTGTGDFFSSGNDLNSFVKPLQSGMSMEDIAEGGRKKLHHFVSSFIDFPKPLIALVNGPAVGITVTTLGLYDYVLAIDEATFHTPFVALGQTPEGCSSYTFPRLMGTSRAKEMLLFGQMLTAAEAYERGLVTRIVPKSEFTEKCSELLTEIANLPPETMIHSKAVMRNRERSVLHDVNQFECDCLVKCWTGSECMQAVTKFFQRSS